MIVEVAKGAVAIGDVDARFVRRQGDLGGEALADQLEADDQIGGDRLCLPRFDARANAPGQEIRIAFNIGDQIEQLVGGKGQHPSFGVGWHLRSSLKGHAAPRLSLGGGQFGGPRRPQRGKILTGVVGRARHRRRRHLQKSLPRANCS